MAEWTLLGGHAENATLEELRVAMEAAPHRCRYIRLALMRSLLIRLERGIVAQQFCRSDRVVRLWIAVVLDVCEERRRRFLRRSLGTNSPR
jgi:hypothetical protein